MKKISEIIKIYESHNVFLDKDYPVTVCTKLIAILEDGHPLYLKDDYVLEKTKMREEEVKNLKEALSIK